LQKKSNLIGFLLKLKAKCRQNWQDFIFKKFKNELYSLNVFHGIMFLSINLAIFDSCQSSAKEFPDTRGYFSPKNIEQISSHGVVYAHDNWLRTGDRGYIASLGKFLTPGFFLK